MSVDESRRAAWLAMQAALDRPPNAPPEPILKGGGGGGTSGGMDGEILDAKIAAAEARTETKFEKLIGRLDSIDGKLTRIEADNLRTRSTVRTTGFTIVAVVVAVLSMLFAVFAQSFNIGTRVADVAGAEARRAVTTDAAQSAGTARPR